MREKAKSVNTLVFFWCHQQQYEKFLFFAVGREEKNGRKAGRGKKKGDRSRILLHFYER